MMGASRKLKRLCNGPLSFKIEEVDMEEKLHIGAVCFMVYM